MATRKEKSPLVLMLGSNSGDRQHNLDLALDLLEKQIYFSARMEQVMAEKVPFDLGIHVDRPPVLKSSVYETEAWPRGYGLDDFLNMAVVFLTDMTPANILSVAKNIETELGRDNTLPLYDEEGKRVYRPRPIDIDIVFYGNLVLNKPDLVIPHPMLEERRFFLEPLNEIVPDYVHPLNGLSVRQMLQNLK